MRVLGSSVLLIEAIVVFLAALVASGDGTTSVGVALAVAGGMACLLVLATSLLKHPFGLTIGWISQGFVLAWGLWVPTMWIVGGVFVVLWFFAVRYGTRIDAQKAAGMQAGSSSPKPQAD